MIVLMYFPFTPGPFCRQCGIAAVRDQSADTLLTGWWGIISFFLTPIALMQNVVLRWRLGRLAEPQRPYGAPPGLNPGKPLHRRFAIMGFIFPLIFIVPLVIAIALDSGQPPSESPVGKCVNLTGDGDNVQGKFVYCGYPHDGQVVSQVDDYDDCPADAEWELDSDHGQKLCVRRN